MATDRIGRAEAIVWEIIMQSNSNLFSPEVPAQYGIVQDHLSPDLVNPSHIQYSISFPLVPPGTLDQDEAYFFLDEGDGPQKFRFHDYDEIYKRPNLYEQIFYRRLKCCSPSFVAQQLFDAMKQVDQEVHSLRVLDFGAGNGIMAEQLAHLGVARIVGVDILEEAKVAALRDRPGIYDDYFVTDLADSRNPTLLELREWNFNCLTCVAALGFGDIPLNAMRHSLELIQPGGWVAFNIKDTFLGDTDQTGFSTYIRDLIFTSGLDLYSLIRYRHRLSIDGEPLYYFAIVARKPIKSGLPND